MTIDGERVEMQGRRLYGVVNPASGETLSHVPLADRLDLDRALEAGARRIQIWRKAPAGARAAVLRAAAALLRQRADEIAHIVTLDFASEDGPERVKASLVTNAIHQGS